MPVGMTSRTIAPRRITGRASRKRRWLRWIVASLTMAIVLVIAIVWASIKLQPTLSALMLPAGAASAPAGPADGSWQVAAGSTAGFRVRETAFGMSNDTVGRTDAVTGTVAVSGDRVTSAAFRIDLATIKVHGKASPQFAASLDARQHPFGTVILADPVQLSPAFATGGTVSLTVTGRLALNGVAHVVTFVVSARRDGAALQMAGSIPVAFAAWGIKGPGGAGFFGSLADHGVAEFLLILRRL
jgi:polyisoprenoid-binding protein YceI